MSDQRFDTLLTALARARTRRQTLAALTAASSGLMAGGMANASGVTVAACHGSGQKCKHKTECCSGLCRQRQGQKKRRCACSPAGESCNLSADCCDAENGLICVQNRCIGSD